jgi:predicted FMN-binding regulatory protein PaiB
MNSTPNPTGIDPNDVLVARADERLAHAYEQIAQADEQLARVTEQISKLEQDAARQPSSFSVPARPPSRDRSGLRGLTGLLIAACILVAAFVSQSSYGEAARPMIARWAPQLMSASSLSTRPGAPSVQLAAAGPAALAQTASQDATAASAPPDPAQLLQTLARDLANLQQEVEQLKASQQQLASDNARAIEEIKASQEQAARDNAKVAEVLKASQDQLTRSIARTPEQSRTPEQGPRPKTSALAPQPTAAATATATRKPVTTPASPQARARPPAPVQLRPADQ